MAGEHHLFPVLSGAQNEPTRARSTVLAQILTLEAGSKHFPGTVAIPLPPERDQAEAFPSDERLPQWDCRVRFRLFVAEWWALRPSGGSHRRFPVWKEVL